MARASTLRTLSDDQLFDELADAKKELFNLRFAFATGQLDNSAQMAATKRDIARMHTVLREREIAAADAQAAAGQAPELAAATGPAPEMAVAAGQAAGTDGTLTSAAAENPAATGDRS